MLKKPIPQQIYRHFKGNLYQIVTLARHSETKEELVIYQALYGEYHVFARPLAMFLEKLDRNQYPDASQEYRFELVQEWNQAPACQEAEEVKAHTDAREAEAHIDDRIEKEAVESLDAQAQEKDELNIDPLVLEFLDADSYEARLNILAALRHRITDDMINTMAVSVDLEIEEGDTGERYEALKSCLLTLERFECNRLR